jgi:hypothetical protein
MKKIIIMILMDVFLMPIVALAEGQSLERIPSPEHLKYYKVMRNENGVLYGTRINNEKASSTVSQTNASTTKMEKIAGPWETKLFEKIKQVGNALWGFRLNKKENKEHLGVSTLNTAMTDCLKTAIDKKDAATKVVAETAKTDANLAVDARGTCQKNILSATSTPATPKAFNECKNAFNQAMKDTRIKAKNSLNSSWQTYKTEIKACYQNNKEASTTVEVSDEGNALLNDGGAELGL